MFNRTKLWKVLAVTMLFAMLVSACVATPPPAAAPADAAATEARRRRSTGC